MVVVAATEIKEDVDVGDVDAGGGVGVFWDLDK